MTLYDKARSELEYAKKQKQWYMSHEGNYLLFESLLSSFSIRVYIKFEVAQRVYTSLGMEATGEQLFRALEEAGCAPVLVMLEEKCC